MSPAPPGTRTTCSPGAFECASWTRLQISRSPPASSSSRTRNDADPAAARAEGKSSGEKRSSAAGGSRSDRSTISSAAASWRQSEREADDRRSDESQRRNALLDARHERARRIAPEQVLERGIRSGAADEAVERGRELPAIQALRVGVGR
jgi:hypothetical protein